MPRGEYTLTKQVGARGYFGKVIVDAEPEDPSGQITVEFNDELAKDWQVGARFGIEYVLEHIPRRKLYPKGLKIRVFSIQGHAVDTNSTVIAFATANALTRALNLTPSKNPDLNAEEGVFVFPK